MILNHCHFFSEVLGLASSLTVLVPERTLATVQRGPSPRYPTLTLLHGLSDDHTIWQRRTSIERYAADRGIAVVMPAVHRSYYADMAHGYRYWTYVSEEVPAKVRDLFPLSARREENFVAGISMGGYGAFKLALRHPERYAAAASLSGAMDVAALADLPDPAWQAEMRTIFGDVETIAGSENDLFHLATQVAGGDGTQPRLYQWCGTGDPLHAMNVKFRDFARTLPLDLTYGEGAGGHTWDQWDAQIEKVLAWLPL